MSEAKRQSNIEEEKLLAYDRLGFYYISLPVLLIGTLFGALVLSALLIKHVDPLYILMWVVLHLGLFFYRFLQYRKYTKLSEPKKLQECEKWIDNYYLGVLLSAVVWGSGAFLVFADHDLFRQIIMILFLLIVGFSTSGLLYSKKDMLFSYMALMYLPLLIKLFIMPEQIYKHIAYLVIALLLFMIFVAGKYDKLISDSLNNRQHFISMQQSHKKLKERFFSLFDRAPVGIFYYNKMLDIEDLNLHFMNMNKASSKDELIGLNLRGLCDDKLVSVYEEALNAKVGSYRGPFNIFEEKTKNYVSLSTVPMVGKDQEVAGGICIVNDITNEINAKQKMVQSAYYDMLTRYQTERLS